AFGPRSPGHIQNAVQEGKIKGLLTQPHQTTKSSGRRLTLGKLRYNAKVRNGGFFDKGALTGAHTEKPRHELWRMLQSHQDDLIMVQYARVVQIARGVSAGGC